MAPLLPSRYQITDYSYALQDAIGKTPAWLVRRGIGILLVVVLGFIFISWWIKYPETVSAKAVVMSSQPPIPVRTKVPGSLSLLVGEGEIVEEGQTVGIIHGIHDPGDIDQLFQQLSAIETIILHEPEKTPSIALADSFVPGGLHDPYAAFVKALRDHQLSRTNPWYQQRVELLETKIQLSQQQKQQAQERLVILRELTQIAEKNYQKNLELRASNSISEHEIDQQYNQLLNQRQQLAGQKEQINHYAAQAAQQQLELLQYRQSHQTQRLQEQLTLVHRYQALLTAIESWLCQHLLTAPLAGWQNLLLRDLVRALHRQCGR